MKLMKIINYSLFFSLLCTFNANAQAKKSPLSILADELDPKQTPTPELDNFQKLELQLDEYDQKRAKHLKEEKEEELKQKAALVKVTPTQNPDTLACELLKEDNVQLLSYVKKLQNHWKKFDVELNKKDRELFLLNTKINKIQRTNKDLFINSDMEWIKNLNDNIERTKKSFDSDMKRYKDSIDLKIENSECNIRKGCSAGNKEIKKFIAICSKWQEDKNSELKKIEAFAEEKQRKILSTYNDTIKQINSLHEKRNYELKIKKGNI